QAGVCIVGGISAAVLLGRLVPDGWSTVWEVAGAAGKLRAIDFYTGLDRAHTIFAGLIGGAFLSMASHGADQLIVQRLLSSRSLRDARMAIIGSGIVVIRQFTLVLLVGIGRWLLDVAGKLPTAASIL